jgi:hypothetical protein
MKASGMEISKLSNRLRHPQHRAHAIEVRGSRAIGPTLDVRKRNPA